MNGLCLIGRSFSFASSGGAAPLPPPLCAGGGTPCNSVGRRSLRARPPNGTGEKNGPQSI